MPEPRERECVKHWAETELSARMFYVFTHMWCAVLPCPALPYSAQGPRQTRTQLCGSYWTGSVAASEIVKEDFIAGETSDKTCLVTIQLWGRRKGFNHRSERQICRSLWLHSGLKEMPVVSNGPPLGTIQFWLCLAFACKWRANLRALRAVETAALLFGERFSSFSEGIWTQFLKQ